MDLPKLAEWFRVAGAPLGSVGVFFVAIAGGHKWLVPALSPLLGAAWASSAAFAISIVIPIILLALAWRVVAKRSSLAQPARFDLRVRRPEELLGREKDILDIRTLIDSHPLVFLDGESGCGKSSMLIFGLMPNLRSDSAKFPVFVSSYSGDWDTGLAVKTFNEAWDALSEKELARISYSERPSVGRINAETVRKLLDSIAETLGRLPVLIFDQFDDYQLTHREQFLDSNQAWVSFSHLTANNAFWRVISNLMKSGRIRVLITTRADAALGLHSMQMIEDIGKRRLDKLKLLWLNQLLDSVVKADENGTVIENPEYGWNDLRKILDEDLARDGAILPQQVRTTLLGLRELADLTPSSYRRAGGWPEVDALFISASIRAARMTSGATETEIRGLLRVLVEHGVGMSAKTLRRFETDLILVVPDPVRLRIVLNSLESNEVIRPTIGDGEQDKVWQLDHDYLARAVLAEERAANRFSYLLRDGAIAWQQAGWNILARWRALLPLSEQARIAVARLKTSFRYMGYRSYAMTSLMRAAPLLALLGFGVLGWNWLIIGDQAEVIVSRLNNEREAGKIAALDLWTAPARVRERVVSKLLDSPNRMLTAGTDWVRAAVSLDAAAANTLAAELLIKLTNSHLESDTRSALLQAFGSVTERLKVGGDVANTLAKELLTQLINADPNSDTKNALLDAIDSIAGRLSVGGDVANTLANELHTQLINADPNSDSKNALLVAFGTIAGRLSVGSDVANTLANELLTQLINADPNSDSNNALLNAIGSIAGRLIVDGEVTNALAKELFTRLIDADPKSDTQNELLKAINSISGRLKEDGNTANMLAKDLHTHLSNGDLNSETHYALFNAIGSITGRLKVDGDVTNALANELLTRLIDTVPNSDAQHALLESIARIAERLNEGSNEVNALVNDLLAQGTNHEFEGITQFMVLQALQAVAGRLELGGNVANALANDLLSSIELDSDTLEVSNRQQFFVPAFNSVVKRLKVGGVEANALANGLLTRLTNKVFNYTIQSALFEALFSDSGPIKEGGAEVTSLAKILFTRLTNEDLDTDTQRDLLDALGRVSGRLKMGDDTANAFAKYIFTRLANEDLDKNTLEYLLDALGRVSSRLKVGDDTANALAKYLFTRSTNSDPGPDMQGMLLDEFCSATELLSVGGDVANSLAKDMRTRLNDAESNANTQYALLYAIGCITERHKFDSKETNALANELLTQLTSTDPNSDTQILLLQAIGKVAGRLKVGGDTANALSSSLRTQLTNHGLESENRLIVYDALAQIGGDMDRNQLDDALRVADLLHSIALPTRGPFISPVWPLIERIAQQSFQTDVPAMMEWATRTYGAQSVAAWPNVAL